MLVNSHVYAGVNLGVACGKLPLSQARALLHKYDNIGPDLMEVSANDIRDDLTEAAKVFQGFEEKDKLKMQLGTLAGVVMIGGGTVVLVSAGPAVLGYAAWSAAMYVCAGAIGGGAVVTLLSLHDDLRATFNRGLKAVVERYEKEKKLWPSAV